MDRPRGRLEGLQQQVKLFLAQWFGTLIRQDARDADTGDCRVFGGSRGVHDQPRVDCLRGCGAIDPKAPVLRRTQDIERDASDGSVVRSAPADIAVFQSIRSKRCKLPSVAASAKVGKWAVNGPSGFG